ncbi:MAG TPA: hypothetical protein DGG95_04460, partial [Cytophagales bacterium]|nr:hypothetical protein [Cytophagales bacterium]
EQNEYMGISVGILPDSSNNYKLVYCVAASCWMPQLAIFSKEGRLISKEQIAQGCGSDCGYGCKDSLIISSSSELKQIFEEWEYDCKQEDQLAKMKIRTVEITYVIGNSGKIESKPTESIEAKSIGQKK